jgi:hypothetical protein
MHTYTKKGSRAPFILKSAKASRIISGKRDRYGPVAGYMHGACLAVDSDEDRIENDPSRPGGTVTASPKLRVGRARTGLALRRLGSCELDFRAAAQLVTGRVTLSLVRLAARRAGDGQSRCGGPPRSMLRLTGSSQP